MSLKIKPTSASNYSADLPEEGIHFAVCVAVVDLGTHTPLHGYQGAAPTPAHKVFIAWELVDTATRIVVGRDFTASFNEKAKLRAWVKAWRGKDLAEGEEFDVAVLAGKPCQLSIEHKKSANGERTYPLISQVTQLRKGDKPAAASHEPIVFDLDSGKPFRCPEWMPFLYGKSIEDWVAESEERSGKKPSAPPVNPEADDPPADELENTNLF